ncbi:MAG TPA: hypothetical protein VEY12_11815 [Thermoplasmata archaeon]|nr:hypothetical protein [Thermoplasmata archaeon]
MEGSQVAAPPPRESTAPVTPRPRKRMPRWQIVLAVLIVAVAIVVPTILIVGPSAPWVEAVLSQGRTFIDVPLTTMYTAPPLPGATVNTSVEMSFSSGNLTCFQNATTHQGICSGIDADLLIYHWMPATGTGLPVQFVMSPEPALTDSTRHFEAGGPGGPFIFYPAGPYSVHWYPDGTSVPPPVVAHLNATETGPGLAYVFVTKWAMDYTVRKMGVFQGLLPSSYLEVDYSLSVVDPGSAEPLPAANVSLPAPGDLWAPWHTLSLNAGERWALTGVGALSSFRVPPPPVPYGDPPYFHHNVTSIALNAGAAGSLVTGLRSDYEWSYETMRFSWNQTVQFHVLVDMRFGGLMLEYGVGTP